jgi:hypothetical protein
MIVRVLLGVIVAFGTTGDVAGQAAFTVWPGYDLQLPAGYCAKVQKGPDFDVFYVHERSPNAPQLLAFYAGYAPNFEPECAKPSTREWTARTLSFKSVRGSDGCAEFLVHDPTNAERGFLHIWFGPGATDHPQIAESFLGTIRPARMPVKDGSNPPSCN